MGRFLFVLPLCLMLHGQRAVREVAPAVIGKNDVQVKNDIKSWTLTDRQQDSQLLASTLALMPSVVAPATLPWCAFYQIGDKGLFPLENILVYQPTLFFQMCIDRYDRDIECYTCLFCKQERVKGELLTAEKIEVKFRQKPAFSVRFDWKEGAGLTNTVYYVEGENKGQLRAKLFGFFVPQDPEGAKAMATSRFSIKQYGPHIALHSTLRSILRAEKAGTLHLTYEGEFKVDKLGGRICYRFVRKPYDPPEEDGIYEYTFYIDKELWMQTGSELKDVNGKLIAYYYFRDIVPNPTFEPNQFTDKGK